MTETSTETLTERLKRQETERADEILKHAEQCAERVKSNTTQLYRSVERSILTDMARTRTLLRTYLFYSCLVALALLIVVPVAWTGGQVLVHLLETELEERLLAEVTKLETGMDALSGQLTAINKRLDASTKLIGFLEKSFEKFLMQQQNISKEQQKLSSQLQTLQEHFGDELNSH